VSRLRVFALACDADRAVLARSFVEDLRLHELAEFSCDPLFRTRALKEEDISVANLCAIWTRGRAEESRLIDQALSQTPNVLIVFVGSSARNSADFSEALKRLLAWRVTHGTKESCLIVIKPTALDINVFDWPADRVTIDAGWAEESDATASHRLLSEVQDQFGATVVQALRGLQREPEVGVGVLLISNKGRFLLAQRLRTPCAGALGTFGGSLAHLESPEQAIVRQGKRQFGIERGMTVGPMLACTHMIAPAGPSSLSSHYIDLTFLAFVENELAAPKDALRHRIPSIGGSPRIWFDLQEMSDLYFTEKLFAPVANAFHRYCNWAALGHVASATGMSNWVDLHEQGRIWMQTLHTNSLDVLTKVAADRRHQISPAFYHSQITAIAPV
jgi:ADP-ribose pyrophosphatase YjhB (NUDIX family)